MIKLFLAMQVVLFLCLACQSQPSKNATNMDANAKNANSIYDFKMKSIDGKEISLETYKGKPLMIVNVASECGFTKQYKSLQEVHEKYGEKFVIIGFPANNFGGQEPGSNEEIATFCSKNFGVSFQMFEKISVKGEDQHALYQWLSNKAGQDPSWNFCKYVVSEDGKTVKFFGSAASPAEIAIETLHL